MGTTERTGANKKYRMNGETKKDIELSLEYKEDSGSEERISSIRWLREWYEFTQSTTLHGLNKVTSDTPFILRKLIWLCIVLIGLGLFLFQVGDRIMYYKTHPITVNLKINHNSSVQFPAVTICNQNSFRLSEAYRLGVYHLMENLYAEAHSETADLDHFQDHINETKYSAFVEIAHQAEDMILSCQWGTHQCGAANMTMEFTDHGVCYTFNYNTEHNVAETGADVGLNLYINVETYEYMPGPHDTTGFKILLSERTEVPLVGDLGQAIPTGSHALIGIQVLQMLNLEKPYGECMEHKYLALYDVNDTYTYTRCFTECKTNFTVSKCNCKDPHMPGDAKNCTIKQSLECVEPASDVFMALGDYCDCPVPCRSSSYTLDTSYASISSRNAEQFLESEQADRIRAKYATAREVAQKVNHHMEHENHELAEDLEHTLEDFLAGLAQVQQICSEIITYIEEMKMELHNRTWFHFNKGLDSVKYIIHHDFIRGFEVMNERTFFHVTSGFYQFASSYREMLRILTTPEMDPVDRKFWYMAIIKDIRYRQNIMMRAFDNFTFVDEAYKNGTPILTYIHSYKRVYDMTWVSLELLSHDAKQQESIFDELNRKIQMNLESLEGLLNISHTAFTNNSYDIELAEEHLENFQSSCRSYNFRKFLLIDRIIYKAEDLIDDRIETFLSLNETFESMTADLYSTANTIHNLIQNYKNISMTSILKGKDMALKYIEDESILKKPIADIFVSEEMESDIQATVNLFKDLGLRGNEMNDMWSRLGQIYEDIWENMVSETSTANFYAAINSDFEKYVSIVNETSEKKTYSLYFAYFFKNIKSYELRKYNDSIVQVMINADFATMDLEQKLLSIRRTFAEQAARFDIVARVRLLDGVMLKSISNLQKNMQEFLDSIVVDYKFMEYNFLKLSVFMQQLSYEEIEQQVAYDVVSLLSDIGGSMGLFIGASIITVFELIDLFVHTLARKLTINSK